MDWTCAHSRAEHGDDRWRQRKGERESEDEGEAAGEARGDGMPGGAIVTTAARRPGGSAASSRASRPQRHRLTSHVVPYAALCASHEQAHSPARH